MSGPTPSTSTQISKTELPEWVNNAGKSNYDEAVRIGNKPLEQYAGPRVAPMSDTTTQAFSIFKDALPTLGADTNAASGLFSEMSDPTKMIARANQYQNPYIDQVENKALDALDRSRVQSLMSNSDKAIKSKMFGGSRSAIVDAVTNAETANSAGILSAGLRKEGFDTANTLARNDISSAAQGLLATGETKQSNALKNLQALMSIGTAEQGQGQKVIDADMAKFDEARNKDTNALNLRMSALGMTPYNTSTTTNGTATQGSAGFDPAQFIMGLLSVGMGAF